MTVTSPNNRTPYVGSGNTGPFEIGFDVSSASSFSVTRVIIATGAETTLTLNAGSNGYTVSQDLTQFTLTESIDSSKRLVVLLNEPLTQNDSYLANNTFPSKTVENELDKLTRIALQQQEQIDRAVTLPIGSNATGVTIPDPDDGKALIWDGTQLANSVNTFDNVIADASASAAAAASSESSATSSATTATTQAGIATAKAVLTAVDVVSTHADVVTTNANASSASSSATTATTGANNAQASLGALKYTFKTSTTMGDPSSANVRFNNATVASVTQIAFSANNAASGNPDVSDFITIFDDSTHSPKGILIFNKIGAPGTFAIFGINGSVTDNSTWLQVPVTYISGNGSLSADDSLFFGFTPAGTDGTGTGTITSIATTAPIAGGTITTTGTISLDISAATTATVATGDYVLFQDISNSNTVRRDTVSSFLSGVSSGALTLLSSQTASTSSAINFDSSIITSTYKKYIFDLTDIYSSGTNTLQVTYSKNNGGAIVGSGYAYDMNNLTGNSNQITRSSSASAIILNAGGNNTAPDGISGILYLNNPLGTTNTKRIHGILNDSVNGAVTNEVITVGGMYTTDTNAINYIRFSFTTGTIIGGTIKCYGVN